ncbi:hypothetical protein ACFQAT_07025 [Undibacterium arcticum]
MIKIHAAVREIRAHQIYTGGSIHAVVLINPGGVSDAGQSPKTAT